jgi:sugar phosphate isomerase/epimerase
MHEKQIRIGTLVQGGLSTPEYIRQILSHGFESFTITFWETLGGVDLARLADEVNEVLDGSGAIISALSIFGNPLMDHEKARETNSAWFKLIDAAHLFNCDLVTGFTGRVVDRPIEESIPRFAEVFDPIAQKAADNGIRLAFENCDMGGDWNRGDWNIAHNPKAWELMFDAVPRDNVGLEWEPCHQMVNLIDPMPQLRQWVSKVFHVHGKDATILWDVIREYGIGGAKQFAFHRTPGFGDSNWTDIISVLRNGGYTGSIDIEGWHDPVYRDEWEMTGQVHALNYLKQCRGGEYVPNPVTSSSSS